MTNERLRQSIEQLTKDTAAERIKRREAMDNLIAQDADVMPPIKTMPVGYGYGDGYGDGYGYGHGYGYGNGTVSNTLGLVGEARGFEIMEKNDGRQQFPQTCIK